MKKFAAFALAVAFAFAAFAETAEEIQNRMRARKDAVVALLATTNAGENNTGYIEKLKDVSDAEATTLAEENADRKKVYAAIAKKENTTEAEVGKRRALQIAERAPAGTMIQDADGAWKKK